MKNRLKSVFALIFICALMVIGLLILTVFAKRKQYEDLMLVVPYGYGNPSYDIREIEQLCEEDFGVTYEIRRRAAAETGNSKIPVSMIGTNISYSQVFGLRNVAGSFFTEEAWNMESRYAVLNETAAYSLFGGSNIIGNTVKLDGEVFMVTGVVKDNNRKKEVVYVPSGVMPGSPEVLMIKSGSGIGEVRNSMAQLGGYESNSRVLDLFTISRSFENQLTAAAFLCLSVWTLFFAYKGVVKIVHYFFVIKLRSKKWYLNQLVNESRVELKRIAVWTAVTGICGLIFLFLAGRILRLALEWESILKEFRYMSDFFTQEKEQWLIRWFYCGPVLFLIFLVVLLLIVVIMMVGQKSLKCRSAADVKK